MSDPTRLIELEEGTSSLERRVLDAARSIQAPAGAKANILAAISSQAALGAGAAATLKSGSLSLVAKSVAAGVVLGVAATAGVTAWVSTPPASSATTAPAPSGAFVAPAHPGETPIQSVPSASAAPLASATRAELLPRRVPERVTSDTESPGPATAAAPSQMAFSDAPLDPPAPAGSVSAEDRAQLESRRVAEARGLLRGGRTAACLVVLNQLMQEFPNGVLTQEREALTIEALLASGERERARALAAAFLRRHPNSPLSASVRRALD